MNIWRLNPSLLDVWTHSTKQGCIPQIRTRADSSSHKTHQTATGMMETRSGGRTPLSGLCAAHLWSAGHKRGGSSSWTIVRPVASSSSSSHIVAVRSCVIFTEKARRRSHCDSMGGGWARWHWTALFGWCWWRSGMFTEIVSLCNFSNQVDMESKWARA